MTTTGPRTGRWLYGPLPDLLFGCGLLYGVAFLVFGFAGPSIRATIPAFVVPLGVLAFCVPHYGATILRVYEQRNDRRSYAVFSLWSTLAVAAAFAWSVYDARVGCWFLTLYLLWSPWHYTGQNYGLAVMFLRRRGVAIDGEPKRVLYASFVLSYAVFFVTMNQAESALTPPEASVYLSNSSPIHFIGLGIPSAIVYQLFYGLSALYLASIGYFAVLVRAQWRELLPTLSLMFTQALWFSIPLTANFLQLRSGIDPVDARFSLPFYVMLTAVGHCTQYLWVTGYYARQSGGWTTHRRHFGKIMIAGAATWALPAVIFAPDLFGTFSYMGGLGLLVASAVNIHHFILDGAIWKLRNLKVGRVLIRSAPPSEAVPLVPEGPSPLRRIVWSIAIAGCAAHVFAFSQLYLALPRLVERGQNELASMALDALAWIGRDDPKVRRELARSAAARGDLDTAATAYRRSALLFPSPYTYSELGALHELRREWPEALSAFLAGTTLAPESGPLWVRAAGAALEAGDVARARALARKALAVGVQEPEAVARLEKIRGRLRALGRPL